MGSAGDAAGDDQGDGEVGGEHGGGCHLNGGEDCGLVVEVEHDSSEKVRGGEGHGDQGADEVGASQSRVLTPVAGSAGERVDHMPINGRPAAREIR